MLHVLVMVVLSLLVATSCGGSDESGEPDEVIEGYLNALAEGDGGEACGHLSLDIRAQLAQQTGSTDCPAAVDEFNEFLGDDADRLRNAEIGDVSVEGDHASGSVTLDGNSASVELDQVDGEWRIATFGFANQLLGIGD